MLFAIKSEQIQIQNLEKKELSGEDTFSKPSLSYQLRYFL